MSGVVLEKVPNAASAAAHDRIATVLSPQILSDVPLVPLLGWSAAKTYRAVTTSGKEYCAKVVLDWADVESREMIAKEMKWAIWAAARGIAPAVHTADAEEGMLITDYIRNELVGDELGAVEPRLLATLRTMRQLHDAEPLSEVCAFEAETAATEWQEEVSRTAVENQSDPVVLLAEQVAAAVLNRLSTMTFKPSLRHGDLHASNVLFADDRAWIIDWPHVNRGDAMEEVAYFAQYCEVDLDGLEEVLDKYGATSEQDRLRARYHLCLFNAYNYLWYLRGLPWHDSSKRETKLGRLTEDLRRDATWLKLEQDVVA